jgi:hypothetical protein
MKKITPLKLAAGVLALAVLACNLSGGQETEATETAQAEALAVSQAAETAAAGTQIALAKTPSATATTAASPTDTPPPTATAITDPFLTADVNSNVRSGPGTVYDILGNLLQGQSADIVGRNLNSTWWVIAFAPAPGGQGWISDTIVTVFGDTSNVPVVVAPPTPTPSPTGDWHGTWVTNCGGSNCAEMVLNQVGDNVTGTYASGEGTLSGVVADNRLSGTWSRSGGSGTFDFWLTGDGKQWRGSWDKSHAWCGHRSGESDPSPCGVAAWYGTWATNCGISACGNLSIVQDGVTIEGSYAGGAGTITGTVNGTELSGTWNRNSNSGSIQFFMFSSGNQFNGNFGGTNAWCGHRNAAGLPGTCLAP